MTKKGQGEPKLPLAQPHWITSGVLSVPLYPPFVDFGVFAESADSACYRVEDNQANRAMIWSICSTEGEDRLNNFPGSLLRYDASITDFFQFSLFNHRTFRKTLGFFVPK